MPGLRASHARSGLLRAAPVALILLLLAPRAAAQVPEPDRGYPFHPPTSSPLEPATRLGPVHASRGGEGGWVALADLGDRIPFWIRRRPAAPFELAASVVGGAFSRFDLERTDNEFVEIHYRVGFQLRARIGTTAARAELYHSSSHLGDEFLVRTGRTPVSTSREGLEVLAQLEPLPGLRVHGGPGVLLRSSESLDRLSARLGLEWRGRRIGDGPFRPWFGAEAFFWEQLDWVPLFASEGGLAFGGRGERYRVSATLGAGRSRAEQFSSSTEVVAGLLFTVTR